MTETPSNGSDIPASNDAGAEIAEQSAHAIQEAVSHVVHATAAPASDAAVSQVEAFQAEAPQVAVPQVMTPQVAALQVVAGIDAGPASIHASFTRASAMMTELNREALDIVRTNMDLTFDLWKALIGTRTATEALAVNAEYLNARWNAASDQTRNLTRLAQKVATDSLAPVAAAVRQAGFAPR